ncbi:MAG: hypothetical protein QOF64_800 [Candidatus Binatota bacterium]|jgi:hypothetical protein|nr:hypothetical protein [Candidatus Binatota bacterium]
MDGAVPIILDRPRLLGFGVNALRLAEPLLHVEFPLPSFATAVAIRAFSIGKPVIGSKA